MISANDREGEDFNIYKDFPRYKPAPCFYMIEKPVSSFYFIEKFLSLSTRKIHRACRLRVIGFFMVQTQPLLLKMIVYEDLNTVFS